MLPEIRHDLAGKLRLHKEDRPVTWLQGRLTVWNPRLAASHVGADETFFGKICRHQRPAGNRCALLHDDFNRFRLSPLEQRDGNNATASG